MSMTASVEISDVPRRTVPLYTSAALFCYALGMVLRAFSCPTRSVRRKFRPQALDTTWQGLDVSKQTPKS